MSTALQLNKVSVGYHGTAIINDLDLVVDEGEMIGVLGPNGAGKTTLLRCITGLCRPLSGTVRLFDCEIGRLAAAERARLVAVVPQEVETPVPFTVEEIVTIGRTAHLKRWSPPSSTDKRIVERSMIYADVADMRHRLFTELSGGEKQRVIVAMALSQEPKMILMDEATSHLDMNHRLEIMQIVERLNLERGVTVVMVSHDLNLAAEFCRRIVLMDHGRVVADGRPVDVLTENTLSRVYNCSVRVQKGPANGSLCVIPAPRLTPACSGKGVVIHVVVGGGCGEELLRRLELAEYTVTAGVLNEGDSDAEVARALGIESALEKPFSPVSRGAVDRALQMVERSAAVVICAVPFGPGNVINLELAQHALAKGRKVLMIEGIEKRDYTPDHAATEKAQVLISKGATVCQSINELIGRLPSAT